MPSHFMPLVPFLDACKRRGHQVAVAAPVDLAPQVKAAGAELLTFPAPEESVLGPLWARMGTLPPQDKPRVSIGEIFAGVCASTALPAVLETVTRWKPDVVVRESMEFASLLAAEKVGIPHARVAIVTRSFEARTRAFSAPTVDGHRRGLGLSPDPTGEVMAREPALTMHPVSMEEPGPAAAPDLRFRGARPAAPPLRDWWPGREGPFVYVTMGTVAGRVEAERAAFRAVVEGLAGLPVRALLTVGNDLPLEALGDVPAGVHVERFVPQAEVLPHADAVVCHGGSGTLIGALAAGVPLVVTPLFADQPYNGARVAAAGAGLSLTPGSPRAAELREALSKVLEDGAYRAAARRIAAEIAALPPVEEAGAAIEKIAGAK
jgi:hypothetical protein